MTREREANERKEAAKKRLDSADRIRWVGELMMILGGGTAIVIMAINIVEPTLPNWLRGNGFTLAGMLYLTGVAFYAGGQSLLFWLMQGADDRAEVEQLQDRLGTTEAKLADVRSELASLRDAIVDVLVENRKLLLSRHGADDAKAEMVRDDAFVDALSEQEDGQEVNGHKVTRLARPRSQDRDWPKRS